MKTLKFKCTLLSDVILNVKAASEGPNATLDFIPGNCFLGIAASQLYKSSTPDLAFTLFHSGSVRFGDAHPSRGNRRGLRIPSSFYYAKGDSITSACHIHHFIISPDKITARNGSPAQLKQCRTGFYLMDEYHGEEITTGKSFALKSAYDRSERRSKEAAMYGYESLAKGLELLFCVEIDDDSLAPAITGALTGERRIGRSRTAQYGLVKIESCDYPDVLSYEDPDLLVIYADARLIFLDENGMPTFRPTIDQLLGEGASGEIAWCRCQVRTFQYAPWNYTRQCFDTDRCGIEKGSVFVITGATMPAASSATVGSYRNEGFGKVLFNPIFLQATDGNGRAKCQFTVPSKETAKTAPPATSSSPLFRYLQSCAVKEASDNTVYSNVNEWVNRNERYFRKEAFASQWGAIRSIALRCKAGEDLEKEINDFISHGVKAESWYGKPTEALNDFIKANRGNLWAAIINLSSEMAKKCSKK